jgi:hypothetical protein
MLLAKGQNVSIRALIFTAGNRFPGQQPQQQQVDSRRPMYFTVLIYIYIYAVVGKVTVIKLLRYVTSYFFK